MKLTRISTYRLLALACLLTGITLAPVAADAAPSPEYRTALFAAG